MRMTGRFMYKAWDMVHKCMHNVAFVDYANSVLDTYGCLHDPEPQYGIPLDNVELLQYTGIKDKYNKDICEGDIIDYAMFGLYKVVWDEECACFNTICIEKQALETWQFCNLFELGHENCRCDYVEIVGNVYEPFDRRKRKC